MKRFCAFLVLMLALVKVDAATFLGEKDATNTMNGTTQYLAIVLGNVAASPYRLISPDNFFTTFNYLITQQVVSAFGNVTVTNTLIIGSTNVILGLANLNAVSNAFTTRLSNLDAVTNAHRVRLLNIDVITNLAITSFTTNGVDAVSGHGVAITFPTGGGAQTPWSSDINAAGYALTNARFATFWGGVGDQTGLSVVGNTNAYFQINIWNTNLGALASSDIVATANTGDESTNYFDMGINGAAGGAAPFTNGLAGYLYLLADSDLHIGSLVSNRWTRLYAGNRAGGISDTPIPIMMLGGMGGQVLILNTNIPGASNHMNNGIALVLTNSFQAPTNTAQSIFMRWSVNAFQTGSTATNVYMVGEQGYIPSISAVGTTNGTWVWQTRPNVNGVPTTNATLTSAGVFVTVGAITSGGAVNAGSGGNFVTSGGGKLALGTGIFIANQATGIPMIGDASTPRDAYGIGFGGASPTNALIQIQSSSIGNSNSTVRFMSGNTNVHLNFEAHDIGTFRTNWTADVSSFVGYTNTTRYNQIWNIRGTSGNIVFWNKIGLDGVTACGIAVWTNTIIASGSDIMVGVNCGIAIDTGVSVTGGGRAF